MEERVTPSGMYVDTTPSYFASASALIQLAVSLPPRRRLLLIVRNDPIARAHSAWQQNVAEQKVNRRTSEPRNFEIAVQEELAALYGRCFGAGKIVRDIFTDEGMARRVASTINPWEGDAERRAQLSDGMNLPVAPGMSSADCQPSLEYCWLAPLSSSERDCKRYLSRGLQAAKLREWQRRYDSSELLVLRMEVVITQNMTITSQRLARFIGVPDPSHETVAAQQEAQTIEHWHANEYWRKRSSFLLEGRRTSGWSSAPFTFYLSSCWRRS